MKYLAAKLTCIALTAFTIVHAQSQSPITNNELKQALEKVISDMPNGFRSLKGNVIAENPQTVEYASNVSLSSSNTAVITKYSGNQSVFSWQVTLASTEDFNEISRKYKVLYQQLQELNISLNKSFHHGLSGQYDAPTERKKFCSSTFSLLPESNDVQKMKIDLAMQYEFPEWKLQLLVYKKEREDNEQGKSSEEGK